MKDLKATSFSSTTVLLSSALSSTGAERSLLLLDKPEDPEDSYKQISVIPCEIQINKDIVTLKP